MSLIRRALKIDLDNTIRSRNYAFNFLRRYIHVAPYLRLWYNCEVTAKKLVDNAVNLLYVLCKPDDL